mgnify:CR=1 FL=1
MEYAVDPYDECFVTESEHLFKKKPPGSISYDSKKKRYRVQGPRPLKKHIGFYNTRHIALEALNYYHLSGMKMESDRTIRKSGTGTITFKKKKYIARLSHIYIGSFDSEKEAIEAIIEYKITGKKNTKSLKS